MKNTAILLCGVPLLLASACTSSFSKARAAINDAPEWYGQRRAEIRGEAYPKIIDIPTIDADWQPDKGLAVSGDEMAALQAVFDTDPRAQVILDGEARIADAAADMRAAFGPGLPAGDFFTETEIAAIRQSFNVPRVTEGLMVQR